MRSAEAENRDTVLRQLCELIAAARPSAAGLIEPGAALMRDLGIDSLAMIEIVIGAEERFGISTGNFEELDLERVRTVSDLADVIVQRLPAAGG